MDKQLIFGNPKSTRQCPLQQWRNNVPGEGRCKGYSKPVTAGHKLSNLLGVGTEKRPSPIGGNTLINLLEGALLWLLCEFGGR